MKQKYYLSFKYLRKKHYRDKFHIKSLSEYVNNPFDIAYETGVINLKNEIKEAEEENLILNKELECLSDDNNIDDDSCYEYSSYELSEEEIRIAKAIGFNEGTILLNNDALVSLSEMRIISLYKLIENKIKEIVNISFPQIPKKEIYRWELLISHLRINGIDIKKINGYQQVNRLRIVNNNIKHSLIINEEVKKYKFFINDTKFTCENLNTFYDNVNIICFNFVKLFGKCVISTKYEISDEKIKEISDDIFSRLSYSQAQKLIKNLITKFKENPKYIPCKQPISSKK